MTKQQYNEIINKVTDMESFFFEKEALEAREAIQEKIERRMIISTLLVVSAYMIWQVVIR